MVQFKSWDDFKKFMEEYATCSCFNCTGYVHDEKPFKGRFVCMRTIAPIRMDLIRVCTEWMNHDGETLKDYEDEYEYRFSPEKADELENIQDMVSFEDIVEVINE